MKSGRERRVRCDAHKPACSACLRKARWDGRNQDTNHGCVYAEPSSSPLLGSSTKRDSASSGSSQVVPSDTIDATTIDGIALAALSRCNTPTQPLHRQTSSDQLKSTSQSVPSARETSKASVAKNSTGPLQKGLACLSCKSRRVKCDGLKPSCSSCIRNARWSGRCPETEHGCVYRADLPQPPVITPSSSSVSTPVIPATMVATTPSDAVNSDDVSSSPSEQSPKSTCDSVKALPPSPTLVPEALPQLPDFLDMAAIQARPFKHAPESPRSLPSLTSGSANSEPVASPVPSPLMSPHGTPHIFFGHDLLPISYPPLPYPPTDIWDAEEFKLPGPAFDFTSFRRHQQEEVEARQQQQHHQPPRPTGRHKVPSSSATSSCTGASSSFKRGANDGYLWNDVESIATSAGVAPSSSGLSLQLSGLGLVREFDHCHGVEQDDLVVGEIERRTSGEDLVGLDGDDVINSESDEARKRQRVMSPLMVATKSSTTEVIKPDEDQTWKIELGGCLSDELTRGWGFV
ncbi:hypothetical protein OIO90_004670 [Microbotryomycetes sp. JL221]|nr:hypothetical protein OIO90_004670 [Microbotryomycetes sp. JL221]